MFGTPDEKMISAMGWFDGHQTTNAMTFTGPAPALESRRQSSLGTGGDRKKTRRLRASLLVCQSLFESLVFRRRPLISLTRVDDF
jgi:hypothetical protein